MEMIAALVYKLVDGAYPEDFKAAGWEGATCDPLAKETLRFLVAQKLTFLCDISALDGFRPVLSGESRVC